MDGWVTIITPTSVVVEQIKAITNYGSDASKCFFLFGFSYINLMLIYLTLDKHSTVSTMQSRKTTHVVAVLVGVELNS